MTQPQAVTYCHVTKQAAEELYLIYLRLVFSLIATCSLKFTVQMSVNIDQLTNLGA